MYARGTHAHEPGLGVWIACQKALRCCERVVRHLKRACVDVNSDNLASMVRFNLRTNVLFIDLHTAPRVFLLAVTRLACCHELLPFKLELTGRCDRRSVCRSVSILCK